MADSLVAKRSLQTESRLKSVIVKPRKFIIKNRLQTIARRIKTINKPTAKVSRRKNETIKPLPKITPELRRKISKQPNDSDEDILDVNGDIDFTEFEKPNNDKGELLRKSTLKPSINEPKPLQTPDPIPPGSTDTTKRIVRIVKKPLPSPSPPKTVNIGVQVGSPFKKKPSIVAPAPLPPLQAYWTHKVNLPYPPNGAQFANELVNHSQPPHVTQQHLQFQHHQLQHHHHSQIHHQAHLLPAFSTPHPVQYTHTHSSYPRQSTGQAVPVMHHYFVPNKNQAEYTRKNRRNFVKRQKYLERKVKREEL